MHTFPWFAGGENETKATFTQNRCVDLQPIQYYVFQFACCIPTMSEHMFKSFHIYRCLR